MSRFLFTALSLLLVLGAPARGDENSADYQAVLADCESFAEEDGMEGEAKEAFVRECVAEAMNPEIVDTSQ